MLDIFKKFLGNKSDRDIKGINPQVVVALEFGKALSEISNDELRAKTLEFRQRIQDRISAKQQEISELRLNINSDDIPIDAKENLYKELDKLAKDEYDLIQEELKSILPEAFGVIKETAFRFVKNESVDVTATEMDRDLATRRTSIEIVGDIARYKTSWIAGGNLIRWDMIHYDTQLIGGVVLHEGKIAEMATGEGKTLVATLPIYLNALSGRGVHIVTVNDYLAKRDSEWMGTLFEFHGLKVDCIDKHEPNSNARRNAYNADVTYGTNNEFGFDYLRDNMTSNPEEMVQRPHNYAIVDEVDSVLIDDARTPLIISGPTPKGENQLFALSVVAVSKLLLSKILPQCHIMVVDLKRLGEFNG